MSQMTGIMIISSEQICTRVHVFFFFPISGFSRVNKRDYKMVSADFEHASFNILCCVVKKILRKRKNNIFGMRLNLLQRC